MKPSVRKALNFVFIFGTLLLVFVIAFSNSELSNAWETLFTLRLEWVVAAFFGWFGYLAFDGVSMWRLLHHQGYRIPLRSALFIATMGYYYSNITPGASGGQPMQIYYLKKRDVPVGIGSSAISVKLLCSQLMMVVLAGVLWLTHQELVSTQLGGVRWIIIIGLAINFAAVPAVILVAFCRPLIQNIGNFFIKIGAKIHIVKHPELTVMRYASTLDTFHSSILSISRKPLQLLEQLFWSTLTLLSLLSVTVSVYHAFDMNAMRQAAGLAAMPTGEVLTLAMLLFISVSYTPLPGASGAQEAGFLGYFKGVFIGGTPGLALLVWRFFSYYMFLIVGGVVSVISTLRGNKRKPDALPEEEAPAEALVTAVDEPDAPTPDKPEAAAPTETSVE